AIGAAYKANTEDPRESPAIEIVRLLREDGCDVAHYDPMVDGYRWPKALADACTGADLLAILIPHDVVMDELNARRAAVEAAMRSPRVITFG
ncbi:MAG: UDP-glucose/GDP-mannose dehydrogenase family protein, partial [Chloroflexota bacterium]